MDEGLLDPRNGSAFDRPDGGSPSRTFIIASVPRSGSTLLARLLWDNGAVGAPKEYLNPMQLRDWEVRFGTPASRWMHARVGGPLVGALVGRGWSNARLRAHLDRVRQRRSAGGWFGLKLHHHHFVRWGGLDFVDQVMPEARWIRISREDRLGQAISWDRALRSGQWAAWQPEGRPVPYRRAALQARMVAIARAEAGWDKALSGRKVWHVTYEQLVADPAATISGTLAWLGGAAGTLPDALPMRRQADARTTEWRRRWQAGI